MDAHRRFLEAHHRADFPRRAITIVGQHENGPLPAVETIDCGSQPRAPLASEESRLRIEGDGPAERRPGIFDGEAALTRNKPPAAPQPRFPPIETAVNEDAGEPDLERPCLAIRLDVSEDLDERILHRF